jgi:hypothetical protein
MSHVSEEQARHVCAEAMRKYPDDAKLPKSAVLLLMEAAFLRGVGWIEDRRRAAGETQTRGGGRQGIAP